MPKSLEAIHKMLDKSHPKDKKSYVQQLSINHLPIQKIPEETKFYLQQYTTLKNICISHCDLRTLVNFPIFQFLQNLDISNNSLQGTFQYIIKNQRLQYLNVSNNFIPEVQKLAPLKRIKNISIYLKNNPLCLQDSWNSKLKNYHIKLLKEPRKIIQPQTNENQCNTLENNKVKQIGSLQKIKTPLKQFPLSPKKSPIRIKLQNQKSQFMIQRPHNTNIQRLNFNCQIHPSENSLNFISNQPIQNSLDCSQMFAFPINDQFVNEVDDQEDDDEDINLEQDDDDEDEDDDDDDDDVLNNGDHLNEQININLNYCENDQASQNSQVQEQP